MSCAELQHDIALYAGGELEAAAAVEKHLVYCAECRALAGELAALRRELAGAQDMPLLSVRSRVMDRLRARRRFAILPWAAAAGLVLAGALGTLRYAADVKQMALPRFGSAAAPAMAWRMTPAVAPRVARPAGKVVPKRQEPVEKTEPLVVKLETDDPNVVIYWLTE